MNNDFGDDIQHVITLEKIKEAESRVKYPHIIPRNKPKSRHRKEHNKKKSQRTLSTWF
jgi:hypothetical protein